MPDCDEPWSPVSIGVDMTEAGAHVVGIYAMSDETSQIFYAKHHPAPQRTWVGLTDGEVDKMILLMGFPPDWITENAIVKNIVRNLEAKLKAKNSL